MKLICLSIFLFSFISCSSMKGDRSIASSHDHQFTAQEHDALENFKNCVIQDSPNSKNQACNNELQVLIKMGISKGTIKHYYRIAVNERELKNLTYDKLKQESAKPMFPVVPAPKPKRPRY